MTRTKPDPTDSHRAGRREDLGVSCRTGGPVRIPAGADNLRRGAHPPVEGVGAPSRVCRPCTGPGGTDPVDVEQFRVSLRHGGIEPAPEEPESTEWRPKHPAGSRSMCRSRVKADTQAPEGPLSGGREKRRRTARHGLPAAWSGRRSHLSHSWSPVRSRRRQRTGLSEDWLAWQAIASF